MQIIISPAKKMRIDNDDLVSAAEPRFLKDTEILLAELRKMQYDDLKKLWQCNDEIAALTINVYRLCVCVLILPRQYWLMTVSSINIWHRVFLKMHSLIMWQNI